MSDRRTKAYLVISRFGEGILEATVNEATAHDLANKGGHYVAVIPIVADYSPARVEPPKRTGE